jgi:nucleoside-diphosphate-sugar epimerase
MSTIVLSGSTDALGQRVRALLAAADGVERIIEVDSEEQQSDHDDHGHDDHGHSGHELKASLEGASAVIQLNGGVAETRALLDAAAGIGAGTIVLLSSATVYGAWPSNPVPLTEDAPLRPNADLEFAVRAAERERLAVEWKADHPGSTVAILRPAIPVAEDAQGWLAAAVRATTAVRPAGPDDPPAQYVHLDDLASAVVLAWRERLDGPFNVAPDGWIPGDQVRALAGVPRLRVPDPVARRLAWTRWKLGLSATPPGLLSYTVHPWVVANDRLKAAGWSPSSTNEEAYVAGHRPAPWATLSPQRRQELALGGAAAALAVGAAGAVALVRRARKGRRA